MKREIRECDLCGTEESQSLHVVNFFGTDICTKCFPKEMWDDYFLVKEEMHKMQEAFLEKVKNHGKQIRQSDENII